jgi:hypothetical protein
LVQLQYIGVTAPIYPVPRPILGMGPINKEVNIMSKSITTNLKTIVKQSTNLPLELTAASVELLADVATLGSSCIKEVIPTAKDVGKATGTFVLGVFNSELSEDELKAKASTLTWASIRASVVAGAGKAGQGLVTVWNEDEATSDSDKDGQKAKEV